jgi:two-component system sensor histidine kinase CreC
MLIVSFGFYILVQWLLNELRPRYLEAVEETMVDVSVLMAGMLEADAREGKLETSRLKAMMEKASSSSFEAKIYELTKRKMDMNVYVVDREGIVVYDSAHPEHTGLNYREQWRDVFLTLQGRYGARSSRVQKNNPQSSILYIAAPVFYEHSLIGAVTVYKPVDNASIFISLATRKMILAAIWTACIAMFFGILFSFWLVRPIEKLTLYARNIRDGRKAAFPSLGPTREVRDLGGAFEEMRETLEGKNYVERYVQTLTHEIKSPVSSIRGAADLLKEEMPETQRLKFLENIRAESDRITQVVEKMLTLSALEARQALHQPDLVDICHVMEDVIRHAEASLAAKGLEVIYESRGSFPVLGEKELMLDAIGNVVGNAIDFSPRGGKIFIVINTNDKNVLIVVEDEGPGIPDFALERVYDRFYSLPRPDTQRKSSGLGLSLAREIMLLHGGRIEIGNRSPASGTRVLLVFPLAERH